jgi:hypothetical protein
VVKESPGLVTAKPLLSATVTLTEETPAAEGLQVTVLTLPAQPAGSPDQVYE